MVVLNMCWMNPLGGGGGVRKGIKASECCERPRRFDYDHNEQKVQIWENESDMLFST